jgi:CBS domain-containing protein
MKVADILKAKGAKVVSVKPTDTIQALSAFLREHRVGAAVVSRDGIAIEGIITERDVTYALADHAAKLHAMPVSALMTKTVITCTPDDDPGRVASSMLSRRFRHIPVADNGRLVGMVSIRDVLKERVDELQQRAAHLRQMAAQMDQTPNQDR